MTAPRIRFAALDGPTDKEVIAAKAVLTRREEAVLARQATARVQCAQYGMSPGSPIPQPCGKWFAIADAVFIDANHWVPPYGCTGGGYWRSGEGQFVCPHCGYLNRSYGREAISKLSHQFAKVVTAYEPESCFDRRLRFDGGDYPYPPHVKARIDAEAAENEAQRLTARAANLRAKAVRA